MLQALNGNRRSLLAAGPESPDGGLPRFTHALASGCGKRTRLFIAIFKSACAGIGITPEQLFVLTVINAHPSIERRLEAQAMLTRENVDHRRGVCLKLTTAGIALLDTAEPCIKDAYQRLTSALTSSECARLVTLSDTLNNRLQSHSRAPFRPL
ncbi:MarR family winged helix-turn-helix transcriptional regulator [Caballeronia sp. BR00000012568055]|uniref:MarR family winged helix-turn-helix transcriptional regulator n=1 Tax=Caballeronia sp. BR00000012568055 TaxID=2918761 RepID=UPI0023F9D7FF|nr:hypothetical protein [Caballeronia sp. BR00000012568055]